MALPFLPGNSFNRNLGKEKYHKSQLFDNKNSVHFLFGDNKPGIGGDPLPGQRIEAPTSRYPPGEGSKMPAWVAFDKQVLSFDAFYQESVNERRDEQYRIRNVKILFYLEDDTIQVLEPRIRNSGLPQGTIIRRHRIAKPAPLDSQFYTVDDFNVGIEINLYGKVFRIISCDEFTHNFLRKLGVRVGKPESLPEDPYSTTRKALSESMQPLRPYERFDTLRQFLDHDRHVLRFYCFWDDTESLYGDPREMVLHYFLSDDTVEIREVIPANSGRDAAPCFLSRQKLPKRIEALPLPGTISDRTLLNVLGHPQKGGRYMLDSLKTGTVHVDYYTDADFTIGSYMNVYGRKFLICDCDEFTKEFYTTKYGITEFKPVTYNLSRGQPVVRENPPYNGWGSEEDSLANCKTLIPNPPQRDFVKFLEKDRRGLESFVLRFKARLVTDKALDQDRRFIISYFLCDDSILVYEPPIRNSGIQGGKFLERNRVKRPNQEHWSTKQPEYYTAADLYVGATVQLNKFKFYLEDADEYAYRYLEMNGHEFPYSNIDRILGKFRLKAVGKREELLNFFSRQDPDGTQTVQFRQLHAILRQLMGDGLVDHEIATVGRWYADRPPQGLNPEVLLGIAQQQLRKQNFESFSKLLESCHMADRGRCGVMPPEALRNVCKTMHINLPDDMLRAIMELAADVDTGSIRYQEFVTSLDWRANPCPAPAEFVGNMDVEWQQQATGGGVASGHDVDRVRYDTLLDDLTSKGTTGY